MKRVAQRLLRIRTSRTVLALILATSGGVALAAGEMLSGSQEVPPVETKATGQSSIKIGDDGSVSGSVETKGVDGTMAHIHTGAKGKNGPPIVTLEKGPDGKWMVPSGAKLSAEQRKMHDAGELYVNVHSAMHKGGEIRAQLNP